MRIAIFLFAAMSLAAQRRPLIVISVDGLDHRYLRDADKLELKIPTLRKLAKEGAWANGMVGAVPTVTWPSHTTMITGVPPREHGILGNRRPRQESGDYYWFADMLRVKTLWHATRKAGLKSAAITWPVTVGADIDFNLPEYFRGRKGGGMDYISIFETATAGLMEKIEKFDPSFRQTWVDDRARKIATVYLLKQERPDLLLLHFVDLDSEAHSYGPFQKEANAAVELTDKYIAEILAAAPKNAVVALVSDHGFERVDREINVAALDKTLGLDGKLRTYGGLLFALSAAATEKLEKSGHVGRRVPQAEVIRFAPEMNRKDVFAAFEPKRNEAFGNFAGSDEVVHTAHEKGSHGFWPGLSDYRATFLLWGKGIEAGRQAEIRMEDAASKFAEVLGVKLER